MASPKSSPAAPSADMSLASAKGKHTFWQWILLDLIFAFMVILVYTYDARFDKSAYFVAKFTLECMVLVTFAFEALWMYE